MRVAPRLTHWRGALRIICGELSPYVRVRVALVLLVVLFGAVMNALAPLALKWIVDGLAGEGRQAWPAMALVSLYVVSQWLARSSAELRALLYAQAEQRVLRTLNQRLFAHVLRLPLRFHLSRQTGAVSQTVDTGLEGIRLILHHLVFTLLPVCAEFVAAAIVLARVGELMFLALFCAAAACYAIVFARSARRIGESASAAASARVAVGAVVTDGLLNCEAVKSFGVEPLMESKAARALARCEGAWLVFHRRYTDNGLAVAAIFALVLAATVVLALRAVHAGRMTVGGFVLVNTYMLQLVRPAEMLGFAVQGFAHGSAMLERTLRLLAERAEQATGVAVTSEGGGAVAFEHVTLSYAPGRVALDSVSFAVAPGSVLGIVGESGSGKSSVGRLLLRLLEPDSGVIRLDGVPLRKIAPTALRDVIAVVPQDPVLFDDTIAANIALGCTRASRHDVEQAARLAQLAGFIESLPDGYDTPVGERGIRLSGGERQRIAIARAVLRRPLVYVLDEATAALDSRTEWAVLESLRSAARSVTTLVIAHRLSTVTRCDQIIVLHAGRVVESGTHETLLQMQGRYAALWRAQLADAAVA